MWAYSQHAALHDGPWIASGKGLAACTTFALLLAPGCLEPSRIDGLELDLRVDISTASWTAVLNPEPDTCWTDERPVVWFAGQRLLEVPSRSSDECAPLVYAGSARESAGELFDSERSSRTISVRVQNPAAEQTIEASLSRLTADHSSEDSPVYTEFFSHPDAAVVASKDENGRYQVEGPSTIGLHIPGHVRQNCVDGLVHSEITGRMEQIGDRIRQLQRTSLPEDLAYIQPLRVPGVYESVDATIVARLQTTREVAAAECISTVPCRGPGIWNQWSYPVRVTTGFY